MIQIHYMLYVNQIWYWFASVKFQVKIFFDIKHKYISTFYRSIHSSFRVFRRINTKIINYLNGIIQIHRFGHLRLPIQKLSKTTLIIQIYIVKKSLFLGNQLSWILQTIQTYNYTCPRTQNVTNRLTLSCNKLISKK